MNRFKPDAGILIIVERHDGGYRKANARRLPPPPTLAAYGRAAG
jgi:hypothetical protein